MTIVNPLISVVMAVKNGENLLREAIDSILLQTFEDFEFIIINDGSTDSTIEILKEYQDSRINIYSQENIGLAKALNRGLALSKGKYIARQDHDDLSLPLRFEKQVDYLENNPHCGLVGTAAEIWGMKGKTGRFHRHPCHSAILEFELLFNNPFVHSSWMFRHEILSNVGYYTTDSTREPPEDYEYVSRIARKFQVANINEDLIIYRELPNSLSSALRPGEKKERFAFASRLALISAENIAHLNNLTFNNGHALIFGNLIHGIKIKKTSRTSFNDIKNLILTGSEKINLKYTELISSAIVDKKVEELAYQYLRTGNIVENIYRHSEFIFSNNLSLMFKIIRKIYILNSYRRFTGFLKKITNRLKF